MHSLLLILLTNPVYSLVFLVNSFILVACILFLLGCEFLALFIVIIYAGAIIVFFLFFIMMLDIKVDNLIQNKSKYISFGIFFFIPFIILISLNYLLKDGTFLEEVSQKNTMSLETYYLCYDDIFLDVNMLDSDVSKLIELKQKLKINTQNLINWYL